MECASTQLTDALGRLVRFQEISDADLMGITNSIKDGFATAVDSAARIAVLTANRIEFLESQSPEQRQWYNGIIDSLFDEFKLRKREPNP